MNDKEKFVEMFINHPGNHFGSIDEKVAYNMRLNNLATVCELKMRTNVSEDILIANGFKKLYEGGGDPVYELKQVERHEDEDSFRLRHRVISFTPACGKIGEGIPLFAEIRGEVGDIYRSITTYVSTLQQVEDALHAIGIDFCFNLRSAKNAN